MFSHWQKIEMKIVRNTSIASARLMFPANHKCMGEWGGPEVVTDFEPGVPYVVKYIFVK
jgi:hypothetical protein